MIVVLLAVYIGILIYDRKRARLLFSQVHIQGKTEQDEVMDFTISLFEDETADLWEQKLNTAFGLREKRLKFQNDRVLAIMEASKAGIPLKLTDEELAKSKEIKG